MLEQILRDMYIDPELLELLDEQQKQTLYCKMREEQVRRWHKWTDKMAEQQPPNKPDKQAKKSVSFLKGCDGEPWVWVMGEHENDKSIDEILKEERLDKARKLAELETEQLRQRLSKDEDNNNLNSLNNLDSACNDKEEDIYCSIDELRNSINYSIQHYNKPISNNNRHNLVDTSQVLKDCTTKKVSSRVALWEQKLMEERTTEILQNLQQTKERQFKEAEEAAVQQEHVWREQERKAKRAETKMREIARRAREEHRLSSALDLDASYSIVNTGLPPGRTAVLEWWRRSERMRNAGLTKTNDWQPWFHGLIARNEAEKLLLGRPYGTFLVRLSERVWGYAISYRASDKIKHYLVNAAHNNKYKFANATLEYDTLDDLIDYHQRQPLQGGDKLLQPCPRQSLEALQELINQ